MQVFRICRSVFGHDLSGEGARIYGGRWNETGTAILYAASSISLAMLEILVHSSRPLLPKDLVVVSINIPDEIEVETLNPKKYPKQWNAVPMQPFSQALGTKWAKDCKSLMLKVPSAVIPAEFNYLVNPRHSLFKEIGITSIEKLAWDQRLY